MAGELLQRAMTVVFIAMLSLAVGHCSITGELSACIYLTIAGIL